MGTTTSQTTDDVDAIINGMSRAPPALDPNYRPPMPPQIQPRPAPASAFGPGAFGSSQPQGGVQSWPGPGSSYGTAPQPPPARSDDSGSGLTPSPYDQPSRQQQGTDPRNRSPDEYRLGQPIWHPRPGEQGYEVAANRPIAPPPPRFQQGNQPGPWPAAYPNSPQINPQNAPALPGETPQETADLNRHMGHESQGQNIMNNDAARNPALYYDPKNPRTCQGYWQIVNSTWRDGAQKAGVDIRQYPTAMSAPYQVQRQVALALYRAYGNRPWDPQPGAGEHGDRAALAPQQPLPPQPRGSEDWGSAPPRDFGPGPTGQQGPFGQATNMQPGQSGFTRVLNGIGPLLLGIASLALRLPLSTAITAYGAMAKAQDNGQREAYERARTQFQDQLKEANAQQALESHDASDAFSEYGNNNPQGLQQTLAQIALKYNDPVMYRMAERGDLNGIHQLQTKRDLYNQDLTKLNNAAQQEQDRQAENAAVTAMDRQWHDKFVQDNGREPTADEAAIAHNENIGKASKAGTKTDTSDAQEGTLYNVIGPDGKDTGKQVREGKQGGMFDASTRQPYTKQPGETFEKAPSERPGGTGKEDTGDFTWTNPDGSPGKGYVTNKPGVGLVDPKGNVIPQKEGTYPSKVSSQSMGAQPGGGQATPGKIEDWDGMNQGDPPPNQGISPEAWTAAQQWAREGSAPKGLSSRAGGIYQQAWHALPYALHAVGKTGADMPQDAINYETRRVAATAAERYFASGQGARQMISLNTVAAHIDLFRQYATAMRNNDEPAMNRVANELAYQTGSPELTNMNIASIVTGDEVIRLLTTTGGSRGDRQEIHDQLKANSSPEQLEGAANALTNFVRERYEPLHLQYTNRLGADDQTRKMYETEWQRKMTEPAKLMVRQGPRPIEGGGAPSQQPSIQSQGLPPRPTALPQGKTQWDKDSGHWRVDGKEYDANGNLL